MDGRARPEVRQRTACTSSTIDPSSRRLKTCADRPTSAVKIQIQAEQTRPLEGGMKQRQRRLSARRGKSCALRQPGCSWIGMSSNSNNCCKHLLLEQLRAPSTIIEVSANKPRQILPRGSTKPKLLGRRSRKRETVSSNQVSKTPEKLPH